MSFINVEEYVTWDRDRKKIPKYAREVGKIVSENLNEYDPLLITLKNNSGDNNIVTIAQLTISGAQIGPNDSILRPLQEDKNFVRIGLTNLSSPRPFGKIHGMITTPYRAGNDEIGFINNDPYHKECHLDTPLIKHKKIGVFSSSLSNLKKITSDLAEINLSEYDTEQP